MAPRVRAVLLAVLGAAVAAVADWGYRSVIASQGIIPNLPNGYWSRVDFVTLFIAGIAAAALGGGVLLGLRHDTAAGMLLTAAFIGAAALGFLAIFGIGLALFLVAALLALPVAGSASTRNWRGWVVFLVPVTITLGVLIGGIGVTGGWRMSRLAALAGERVPPRPPGESRALEGPQDCSVHGS